MSLSSPQASSSSSRLVSVQPARTAAATSPLQSSSSPATPLRPITSPTGFTFPAIWSFPPFFTLQPNPSTLAHQLALWTQLVLAWARHGRVLTVQSDAVDGGGEVFWNKGIQRRLLPPAMKQLLAHMAAEGHAAPDPPKQSSTYLLYWRKPDEWGQIIYDWIVDTGQTGSILTFYELTEGDLAETTEFRNLHPSLLRRAIETVVKRGKAQIIRGEGDGGDGVRFVG